MLATTTAPTLHLYQEDKTNAADGLLPVPVLEDYDISPITGFVPHDQPLPRLPQSYFQPWEETMDQLNHLIDSRQLRSKVDQWPILDVTQLSTLRERQRAYVLLSFVAHSYIWGSGLDISQVRFKGGFFAPRKTRRNLVWKLRADGPFLSQLTF